MKTFATMTLFGLLLLSAPVAAQEAAVVQRLVQNGQMPRRTAQALVRKINQVLRQNAQRGGNRYDPIRQAVNQAVFGANAGPGAAGSDEFNQRLQQVLTKMRGGVDLAMLSTLFPSQRNSAVLCAHRFSVTIGECDALIAAATTTPAALPYLPPDDGRALTQSLRGARVNNRFAREISSKLGDVMLGVPGILTNDERGRGLIRLLEACPGGTPGREAQIRAWHVGPTEGLARCIAGAVARHGGAEAAQSLLGLSSRAATAFIEWGAPNVEPAAAEPPPQVVRNTPPPTKQRRRSPTIRRMSSADSLRQQARAQFRLGNFDAALQAYQGAAEQEPNHAGTHAAMGACKLQLRDFEGAVAAYSRAVELDAENDNFLVALGRAYAGAGKNEEAIASLQQAMRVNRDNMAAREGLRALGGEPPPPPLPEVPERAAIIGTMAPLRGALMGCSPSFSGHIEFRIKIIGETGEVIEVGSEARTEINDDDRACMESVVQSARFPRFVREELSITYPFELGG